MQIEAALVAWRERRDPKLGDLIVSIGASDPAITGPLGKLKPTHLVKALIDELSSPDRAAKNMGSLVPHIDHVVRTTRGTWPLIELLADAPADPRVGRIAIKLLDEYDQLQHTTPKLWRGLLAVVDTHGDPSCVEILRALQAKLEGMAARRVGGVATRLAKAKPLTKGELAALEGHTVATDQGEALLAAVYADPSSDAAREIYADHLIAAGDPRGEFIQLQLQRAAGTSTEKGIQRERALLTKHWKAWLGPLRQSLAGFVDGQPTVEPCELRVPENNHIGLTTFARGFVYRIHALVPSERREAILNDPMLATIRIAHHIPKLTPVMRALASIEEGTSVMLGARAWDYFSFADTPTPAQVRVCKVRVLSSWDPESKTIDAARANPTIEAIEVAANEVRWTLRTLDWGSIKTLQLQNRAACFTVDLAASHSMSVHTCSNPWSCEAR